MHRDMDGEPGMRELDEAQIAHLSKNIVIPPRPAVLLKLQQIKNDPNADLAQLAHVINQDVSLAGTLLKAANSPFYALSKRISSVGQAVTVLGTRNVIQLTTGIALQNAIGNGQGLSLERFWDSAMHVAQISALLAPRFTDLSPDECYSFGLFRDCGIPVMLLRYPDYKDTMALANQEADSRFPEIEDARHHTNHVSIGYLVARSWLLPDDLAQAILLHHDHHCIGHGHGYAPPHVASLIAIARLAEHISAGMLRLSDDVGWNSCQDIILDFLGINEAEIQDLSDPIIARLQGDTP